MVYVTLGKSFNSFLCCSLIFRMRLLIDALPTPHDAGAGYKHERGWKTLEGWVHIVTVVCCIWFHFHLFWQQQDSLAQQLSLVSVFSGPQMVDVVSELLSELSWTECLTLGFFGEVPAGCHPQGFLREVTPSAGRPFLGCPWCPLLLLLPSFPAASWPVFDPNSNYP